VEGQEKEEEEEMHSLLLSPCRPWRPEKKRLDKAHRCTDRSDLTDTSIIIMQNSKTT
jgi:hypothetical protein